MIVQQVPPGETPIVICNVDHAIAAGQLAEAFGNAQFARLVPHGLLAFVARSHEEGWRALDAQPQRNPATGLPYHLAETPADLLIRKSVASPDFNERYHPWCGLLSSMHAWGLYNNRYGISDAVSIEQRPAAHADDIALMLETELARQERLKAQLRSDPATAPWVEDEALITAYKLLEFFDTLALWWQLSYPSLRRLASFTHVPAAIGEDLTLTITPTGRDSARVVPYPFGVSPVQLTCRVRTMPPSPEAHFAAVFAEAPVSWQRYTLTD